MDVKLFPEGFDASTNLSKFPNTMASFKKDSSEITPFCSNFRNEDKLTPERLDNPS